MSLLLVSEGGLHAFVEEVSPCGEVVYVEQAVTTHTQETYVPPREVYNSIYKISREMSYTQRLSKPYRTYQILSDVSHNARGYGRPKLGPRAHHQMKAWAKLSD